MTSGFDSTLKNCQRKISTSSFIFLWHLSLTSFFFWESSSFFFRITFYQLGNVLGVIQWWFLAVSSFKNDPYLSTESSFNQHPFTQIVWKETSPKSNILSEEWGRIFLYGFTSGQLIKWHKRKPDQIPCIQILGTIYVI